MLARPVDARLVFAMPIGLATNTDIASNIEQAVSFVAGGDVVGTLQAITAAGDIIAVGAAGN